MIIEMLVIAWLLRTKAGRDVLWYTFVAAVFLVCMFAFVHLRDGLIIFARSLLCEWLDLYTLLFNTIAAEFNAYAFELFGITAPIQPISLNLPACAAFHSLFV